MKTLKHFSLILFIAITILTISACGTESKSNTKAEPVAFSSGEIGEGENSFVFTVTGADGKESTFVVNTNEKTVGDALKKVGLIDGEDGQYGLYVKTVNGTTLDYNRDGKYWAFYINGEYATSGVDKTEIEADTEYAFKAE